MLCFRDLTIGIVRMARPLVLLSTFSSWFLGVAMAYGLGYGFSWGSFITGLAVMILLASSIHFANEYIDYETDAETRRTWYSGGSGVLPSGLVPRPTALKAAIISGFAGLLLQGALIMYGQQPIEVLILAVIGTVGGWIYSVPPKLSWRGLGEAWNALLGAWLLPYFGFVQMSKMPVPLVLRMVIPVTFLAFNNLLAVTWPDRKADAAVGKRTLATRLNPRLLRILHGWCILMSAAALAAGGLPRIVQVASVLAYPLAVHGWLRYTRNEVAEGTVWGLHLLIVAQTVAWLVVGSRAII